MGQAVTSNSAGLPAGTLSAGALGSRSDAPGDSHGASSSFSRHDHEVPPTSVQDTVRLAFGPAADVDAARAYTRRLAHGHYENFSVVSLLLPRHLRQDCCNVYAFCRTADDLADEVGDKNLALQHLGRLRQDTLDCYRGSSSSALFVALAETIERHAIPPESFLDLIDAFEQDQRVGRYDTFENLLDYCRRSANPVGRMVLYLCGFRDSQRQHLSDQTCTALQLANFWQDVRSDLLVRDRIYIPGRTMDCFGVSEQQIRDGVCDENFRALMRFEIERTQRLFDAGDALLPLLPPRLRRHVSLFGKGGRAVLHAIRRQDFDTLSRRPVVSRWQKVRLMVSALAACAGRPPARGSAAWA